MTDDLSLLKGDVTAAVLYILRNDERLNARYPDVTVAASNVGFTRLARWITVTRRGGVVRHGERRILDRARVDVDTYGKNRTEVVDLAGLVATAVANMSDGRFVGYGLTIIDIGHEQGISELPDPASGDPRAFQTLEVVTAARPDHPQPAGEEATWTLSGEGGTVASGNGPPPPEGIEGITLYIDLDTGDMYQWE